MSNIEAVSFDEVECGKKVAESKKRFKWNFKIDGLTYNMELANSALSGKRVVNLNGVQIYNQKSILNINFDFNYVIEGHTLRISRTPDNINKFQMRIDNQTFEDLLNKKSYGYDSKEKTTNNKKVQNDPFSQFGNFVGKTNANTKNNDFGDFDFDSFPSTINKSKSQQPAKTTQKAATKPVFDPFGGPPSKTPSATNYETVNFQTNTFQTNNFGNFFQNFNKVESNLLDQDSFSTNTFGKNNLYNDLVFQKPMQKSDTYGQAPPKTQEAEVGFLADKINSLKIEMSAKQVMNKVKKTAQQLKGKISGQDESLI